MWVYLEILGTVVGLLYLWHEYRASIWLWPIGIVMPAIYIFVYYHGGFYADVGINIYYLLAGVYGWAMWLRGRNGKAANDNKPVEELRITSMPVRYWLPIGAVVTVMFAGIAALLINFTDSTVPYGDSFTTALSIAALWMLSRKYTEQWLVWLVVDAISAGLYLYKGLYFTGGLYAFYAVMSVFGYLKWKKMSNETIPVTQ